MISKLFVTLSRLCVAAWVGIATFFVAEVISLRASPLFNDATKLNHPRILFPLLYLFEFWLLGAALACGLAARSHPAARRKSWRMHLSLVAAALLVAVADYLLVYRPLAAMIELSELPAGFAWYHQLSRWINTLGLLLSTAAACCAIWPGRDEQR